MKPVFDHAILEKAIATPRQFWKKQKNTGLTFGVVYIIAIENLSKTPK